MALKASEIERASYLRLLVLGSPKSGKTTTAISTCELPAFVINSDDKHAVLPATRFTKDFEYANAFGRDIQEMETAIGEARRGVKEGKYKTVVWDTLTMYGRRVEEVFANSTKNAQGEADGRRYWSAYRKHLEGIVDRLFMLDAHVIVTAHYLDMSSVLIEGQVEKVGQGVVPNLGGAARLTIPAMFNDVVFLDKKGGERFFVTSSDGMFGPGGRNLPGVSKAPANIKELWALMNKTDEEVSGKKGKGK